MFVDSLEQELVRKIVEGPHDRLPTTAAVISMAILTE